MAEAQSKTSATNSLKLCVACGALNHGENCCCCNCSWDGGFDYDETRILEVIKNIEEDVENILQQALTEKVAWTKTLSVRIKSVLFSVRKFDDCQNYRHNHQQAACD